MSLLKILLNSTVRVITHFFISLTLSVGLLVLPINSSAEYAPSLKWHTIETQHFLIHYHTGLKSTADEIASLTKDIHDEVTQYFNWVPKKKTHIVLSDQSEKPNGSASVFPNNRIELFMSPPSDIAGLEDYQNWKRLVLKHEYVHIVHLDKAEDLPLHGRDILGRFYLFFPNTFLPRWITEGIATFIETDEKLKTGRGQSNFYRGMMRNEVIHGIKSLNQINQYRTEWPNGTGFYLYGVYFFNFIQATYGREKIADFVDHYSHFPIPYFINIVSKETFGKNMFELWSEFEIYLNKEFAAEIQLYNQQTSADKKIFSITNTGYNSGFSRISNNKLYFIRSDRENLKELVEQDIESKNEKIITKIIKQDYIFPHSFDINEEKGILIPLLETYENSRESFDLYNINLVSGKKTRLTTNKRYLHAAWNTKGDKIIALGNGNGNHRLDLLDKNGKYLKTLWKGESGIAINAFDWSPIENSLVVSLFTPDKGWNLSIFNIDNLSWRGLTSNSSIESYPQFNKAGTHIVYSADYDNIYNAYTLNLNSNEITQLTKSSTIALFPTLDEKSESIYFTELDEEGFNLKTAKTKNIPVEQHHIPKQTADFFRASIYVNPVKDEPIRPYSGISYLAPSWILPMYIIDDNQSSFGFLSRSSDPLYWHNYAMKLFYDVKNLEFRWNVNYINQQHTINFIVNSRQESFNSAVLEQRESETSVAFILPYIKRSQKWQLFSSVQHLETKYSLPNTNISLRESNFNFTSGVSIDTTTTNLRSVSNHNGIIAGASYEVNKVQTTFKQHSRVMLYGSLYSPPLKRAVFEAGGTIIIAGGNAKRTYLGGSSTESISDITFGINRFPLHGYILNQFVNTNMQKISALMHYPLFYPETGFMRPPFGFNRFNLTTIAETARVGTYHNINDQEWLKSLAMEVTAKANFGFGRYPFDFTVGIAKGFNELGDSIVYHKFTLNF